MVRLNKFINWLRAHLKKILFCVLILSIAYGVILIKSGNLFTNTDKIQYFGFVFTAFSILYAALEFRSNHDWHRRQLATASAKEIRDGIKSDLRILNAEFEYFRLKAGDRITVDDIHSAICKKDDDGAFIYKDGKLIVDDEGQGPVIRDAIYNVLNSYEYIAAGVYEGAFDRGIIKTLLAGVIIKAHSLFKDYIKHMNEEMRPERGGKIWACLKTLATEFKKEEIEEGFKPKKRRKTG